MEIEGPGSRPVLSAPIGPDGGVNPFRNKALGRTPTIGVRMRQFFVIFSGLLFVRIFLTLCSGLVGFFFAKLATVGLRKEDYDSITGKQLACWRQWVAWPALLCNRFQMMLFGFWWIPVKGRRATKDEAPILIANHTSGMVDGMCGSGCARLAEGMYAGMPIMSAFMIASQSIFVDRRSPESRKKAREGLMRRCEEPGWPQTFICPEGCCTNGSALVQFKTGAFAAGKPVQPMLLRYSPSPCGGFDTSFTYPSTNASYVIGMMMQIANFLEIEYMEPVVPTPEEQKDPVLFTGRVQQMMADALGIPCTKHAGEDLMLAYAAQEAGMSFTAGYVQWQRLTQELSGMNVKGALKILEQFRQFDPDRKGQVDFQGFSKVMRKMAQEDSGTAPSDDELRRTFDMLDRDDDGQINFEEYLATAAVINGHEKEDRTAGWHLAFDLYAKGAKDFSKDDARELASKAFPQHSGRFDELFAELDTDANGRMSREEFLAFVEKHQEDLDLRPKVFLRSMHLPMDMAVQKEKEKETV